MDELKYTGVGAIVLSVVIFMAYLIVKVELIQLIAVGLLFLFIFLLLSYIIGQAIHDGKNHKGCGM